MPSRKAIVVAAISLGLAISAWAFVREIRHANWLAEQSALAALDKEISDQLAAVPPNQEFPAALSELPLTYPDGGDKSLLSRFEYSTTGNTCSYRTSIFDTGIVRSFPATE